MAEQRSAVAEAAAQAVESLRGKGRMGACTAVGWLAWDVPPHWSAWLAGEVATARIATWAGATAAVVAGVIWVGFQLAGHRPPKAITEHATGDTES